MGVKDDEFDSEGVEEDAFVAPRMGEDEETEDIKGDAEEAFVAPKMGEDEERETDDIKGGVAESKGGIGSIRLEFKGGSNRISSILVRGFPAAKKFLERPQSHVTCTARTSESFERDEFIFITTILFFILVLSIII